MARGLVGCEDELALPGSIREERSINGTTEREAISSARRVIFAYEKRLAKLLDNTEVRDAAHRLDLDSTAAQILSHEDQRILVMAAQFDYAPARSLLVSCNQRFIIKIANAYRGQGLELEDLRQEGAIGIEQAIQKYSFDEKSSFLSYAKWWIRHNVRRAVQEKGDLIALPSYMHAIRSRVQIVMKELAAENIDNPTLQQVVERVNKRDAKPVTAEQVSTALEQLNQYLVSLDARIGDDEDLTLSNSIADEAVDFDEEQLMDQVREVISRELDDLPPLQKTLLERKFGLNGEVAVSNLQLMEDLGLTKGSIDNHLQKAMTKMIPGLVASGISPSVFE